LLLIIYGICTACLETGYLGDRPAGQPGVFSVILMFFYFSFGVSSKGHGHFRYKLYIRRHADLHRDGFLTLSELFGTARSGTSAERRSASILHLLHRHDHDVPMQPPSRRRHPCFVIPLKMKWIGIVYRPLGIRRRYVRSRGAR
jgi:hypothetical protein